MHEDGPTPLPPATCLARPYPASQKGGTLIAVAVRDLESHLARLSSPDGYRPPACPTCGHPVMHAHEYRDRQCQLPGAPPVIRVARHRCAHPACGAQWQTLPGFLARRLHFNWPHVEQACRGRRYTGRRVPSLETLRRWRGRLRSSAAQLMHLACEAGGKAAATLRAAWVETRLELVDALGASFAEVAAWIHQLQRGLRLM
jgi:hypothetical protein